MANYRQDNLIIYICIKFDLSLERQLLTNDWFSISLLIILSTFVVLKLSNTGKYAKLIGLEYVDYYWLFNNRSRKFLSYFEFTVFLLAHLILAQFLYIFYQLNFNYLSDEKLPAFYVIMVFFVISILCSLIKFYIEKFINYSINQQNTLYFFIYFKQFVWTYALFLAYPFLILYTYFPIGSKGFLYGFVCVWIGFTIYKLALFGIKNRAFLLRNWFYFILYICTLEIAPYIFIIKLFNAKHFF